MCPGLLQCLHVWKVLCYVTFVWIWISKNLSNLIFVICGKEPLKMQTIIITGAWLALLKALLKPNLMTLSLWLVSGALLHSLKQNSVHTLLWSLSFYARMKIVDGERVNPVSLGVASSEWRKVQNWVEHQIVHLILLCISHTREVLSWQ